MYLGLQTWLSQTLPDPYSLEPGQFLDMYLVTHTYELFENVFKIRSILKRFHPSQTTNFIFSFAKNHPAQVTNVK